LPNISNPTPLNTELAGVPNRLLGDKVASMKNKRDEIIAALDMLFTGI
jgi:toxin CcdB